MRRYLFFRFIRATWCARLAIVCVWWLVPIAGIQAQKADALYLLNNKRVQYSVTAAMDSMYNFKFQAARTQYQWLQQEYPQHPLPYFLIGLNLWWQMIPNTDDTTYEPMFLDYMDTSIYYGKRIIKEGKSTEGAFLLAVTYAYLGRFHGERNSWLQASWAGRNAMKYLEIAQESGRLELEIMLGDALYNYYSVWIREQYPRLKLLLSFFKKGDKELGLHQLDYVARNSLYARIEAQLFLMRILNEESENKEEPL